MPHPLDDIRTAISTLEAAPPRGRVDSSSEAMLQHVAGLMRISGPVAAWLEAEAERLALTPIGTDLSGEHAVLVARALLTPITGRPEPGQPGAVIDNVRATLEGILRSEEPSR
ncbi:hypothetical protein [Streptomyces sp. NPDC088794]|uniref:hypothetical protein n=1 Tax=Streptomyces sp. NPDC088794 TaxID=3365902 RepID=UPI0037FB8BFA